MLIRNETRVGQTVQLTFQGEKLLGSIVGRGPKYAKVRLQDGRLIKGSYFGLYASDERIEVPADPNETARANFKVGDTVLVGKRDKVPGVIFQMNAKRCQVRTADGTVWSAPYASLAKSAAPMEPPKDPIEDFRVGQMVHFGRRSRSKEFTGVVTKVNRRSLSVMADDGEEFRVPPALAMPAKLAS